MNKDDGFGRSPAGPGYSAEPEPSCTVSAVPVSIPNAASWAVHYNDGGERLAVGYNLDSRSWPAHAFIRCYESADETIYVELSDARWLGERLLDIASAIEARQRLDRADGLDPKGESAVGASQDAQPPTGDPSNG